MKKIVIMTHAGLAQGAKETVQFLAGNCEFGIHLSEWKESQAA